MTSTAGHLESVATNPHWLFLRQAPDPFHQDGRVTSEAFVPQPRDEGRLSGNLSSVTSARESSEYRAKVRQRPGQCVWGLTVSEVGDAGLEVLEDSVAFPEIPLPPGHASLDFRAVLGYADARHRVRDIAADFAILANQRGRLHPDTDPSPTQGSLTI